MKYSISNIASIINASSSEIHHDDVIDAVLTDSRRLVFPASTLFFAIDGPRRKGTDFIRDLYRQQVRNFVIDVKADPTIIEECKDANFIQVNGVLTALQQLAIFHRNQSKSTVLGITGSNGKTIVKEWLFQMLVGFYDIIRSPKSFNSQIGVPLSVLQLSQQNNLAIFEAGISLPGEMDKLQPIINPEIGVLTYIGDAHAEGFEHQEQKIQEKLKLFSNSKLLIYCSDNQQVNEQVVKFAESVNKQLQIFSWSKGGIADLQVDNIQKRFANTDIQLTYQRNSFAITIPFTDEASIYNAITCCAVSLCLGIDKSTIAQKMRELTAVAMRLELKQAINHCAIINDSYNADLDSLNIALEFLFHQQGYDKKTLIISDMFQSGLSDRELYEKIAGVLVQKKIGRLIGIGERISAQQEIFKDITDKQFFKNTEAFLCMMPSMTFSSEAILLKGSRIFEFEKISNVLEQKLHDTLLEINLNAIRQNIKLYRQKLSPSTKIMAMVKAFSYGSGSVEIASVLQREGVDYLAVAYTDEAVELRKGGVRLPIMVMNANEADFDNIIRYQLEPEIYSFTIFNAFRNHLHTANVIAFPIHLKLDTGMHRLGFMKHEIPSLCEQLHSAASFEIRSVFSHLVASENPEQDAFTFQQAALFEEMANQIQQASNRVFIKHIANTSAIHRHPSLQFDMVRLGIGMYGVDSNLHLHNVTTLKTTIAQIKHLKAGDTVGYGRKGVLNRDSVIATVRIGYADGYPRTFGNGNGKMLVNGSLAPVIGNVCMDMTMLDITGINTNEGDTVIVFGEALPVQKMAEWAGTIPYEILTNISQRVKRVYFEE